MSQEHVFWSSESLYLRRGEMRLIFKSIPTCLLTRLEFYSFSGGHNGGVLPFFYTCFFFFLFLG